MTRSALVVLVEAAEPLVAAHRKIHDPMAARGVPAHVTALHPFRPVVDEVTAAEVAAVAARIEPFDAVPLEVPSLFRFPGEPRGG